MVCLNCKIDFMINKNKKKQRMLNIQIILKEKIQNNEYTSILFFCLTRLMEYLYHRKNT